MVAARMGCPLLVGLGEGENFVASDVSAIVPGHAPGDLPRGRRHRRDHAATACACSTPTARRVERDVHVSDVSLASLELGPYRHFMQKEIHEQPRAIADTIEAVIDNGGFSADAVRHRTPQTVLRDIEGVQILACGTSYYAGLTARYWIEAIAGLPCAVEIASEYRYRTVGRQPEAAGRHHLAVGRNARHDGGAEVRQVARPRRARCRSATCPKARSRAPAGWCFYTRAGAEIGVASTKAFTTQLVALFTLTVHAGQAARPARRRAGSRVPRRAAPPARQRAARAEPRAADRRLGRALRAASSTRCSSAAACTTRSRWKARSSSRKSPTSTPRPIRPASSSTARWRWSMRTMPVVVIAPNDSLLEKVKSNMQEVRARGGELFVFADDDSHFGESEGVHVIRTPRHVGVLSPDRARDPGAAAGVPRRAGARHRRRQAAQPGQVGDGGIAPQRANGNKKARQCRAF